MLYLHELIAKPGEGKIILNRKIREMLLRVGPAEDEQSEQLSDAVDTLLKLPSLPDAKTILI